MEEQTLYLHLHKLAAVNSEEVLENVLTTIWKTRKTGLRPPEKSRLQSVLSLPALADVDPVIHVKSLYFLSFLFIQVVFGS